MNFLQEKVKKRNEEIPRTHRILEEENEFYNSQGYKYIIHFAKKYSEKGKFEDFNQL